MGKAPNIIICMCDQLRAHELGCYGHPLVRSQNIDRLAAEGMRFESGISNNPVCMPARSVLISGQYSRTCCGALNNTNEAHSGPWLMPWYPQPGRVQMRDTTLAEALRGAGYQTTAIGKWHIEAWPHEIGFDHYIIPRNQHAHLTQHFTEDGGPEFVAPGYSVDYEVERVQQYLGRRAASDQPFFLFYNISPPHMPLAEAPEKYLRMYDPEEVILRENVPAGAERDIKNWDGLARVYQYDFRHYRFKLPYTMNAHKGYTLRHCTAQYDGLTTWVDDCVGRLMHSLEANGLAEDTIVVFTSDHGDNLGSHGLMNKTHLIEESIRIPLIVRWPGRVPARPTTQVASLVDMMPSLLELAGIEVPECVQGRSVAPAMKGEQQTTAANHAFIETGPDGVGVRTPTHLYGLPWQPDRQLGEQPHRFYDLTADPYELDNLAGTGRQRQTADPLDRLLREWHAGTPWL